MPTPATLPPATAVRPSAPQLQAWRVFLRAHDAVTRVLEDELEREQEMSLPSYDVLVQLCEVPQGLRMSELAGAVLLSRSGLTRLVDRLEREGLVERRSCPSDARGTLAVLTPLGRERLRTAAPTHLRGVVEHFAVLYDEGELATLGELLGRLAGPESRPAGGCGA